jgi:hypothetical protein
MVDVSRALALGPSPRTRKTASEIRGARFSSCGVYRYELWRSWNTKPPIVFLMLNPSTADAERNDPTVERCERRARALRAGGVIVVNIFALRSTDPKALYRAPDPVGPENDESIVRSCATLQPRAVICAWGRHGNLHGRGAAVLALLRTHGVIPMCLGLNGDGTPKHPLYLRYSAKPIKVPRR